MQKQTELNCLWLIACYCGGHQTVYCYHS